MNLEGKTIIVTDSVSGIGIDSPPACPGKMQGHIDIFQWRCPPEKRSSKNVCIMVRK